MSPRQRTVGVEEEFLVYPMGPGPGPGQGTGTRVVERGIRGRRPGTAGDAGTIHHEFHSQQVETNTAPYRSMDDLESSLIVWRRRAAAIAAEQDCVVVPSGTPPAPLEFTVSDTRRYRTIAQRFGMPAVDGVACGMHVHVQIDSTDEGVAVLDRIRGWLPLLLALSANSPLWHGRDTGYASYRSQLLSGWPLSGPTPIFGSAEGHRVWREQVLATGVPLDEAMVFADARLSCRFPTVEVRVMDVPLHPHTSVLLASLVRALVDTASADWNRGGGSPPGHSTELLRLASWQAARFGLAQDLLDPLTMRPVPAARACAMLLEHIGPALETNGDLARCVPGVRQLVRRGPDALAQQGLRALVTDRELVRMLSVPSELDT